MESNNSFDIDLIKIKSINKINLEIFNRLKQKNIITNNTLIFKNIKSISFNNETNQQNSHVQYNRRNVMLNAMGGQINTQKNQLICYFTSASINIPNFSSCFDNINFFNDKLPNYEYFDLDDIISKYEMLNPSKALPVIIKWKDALEKIQVSLGKIETEINENTRVQQQIFNEINIDIIQDLNNINSNIVIYCKQKYNNCKLSFEFQAPFDFNIIQSTLFNFKELYDIESSSIRYTI